MNNFKKPNLDSLEENYKTLVDQIDHLIEKENDITAILSNISSALKETFNFLWVGFYLIKNEELVLGPFQGPVACFRIKKNEGVCGYCYTEKKTIIVPDVNTFPRHIACSSLSKSEIVVPIFKKNDIFGVLDVDSKSLNQFNVIDKTYLEKIVKSIEKKLT
jgi:GAF domain-containing protein